MLPVFKHDLIINTLVYNITLHKAVKKVSNKYRIVHHQCIVELVHTNLLLLSLQEEGEEEDEELMFYVWGVFSFSLHQKQQL